jgi:glycogen synthase
MLCGRPAVVSDVGGNTEWVHEPETGFVSEAPSRNSFGDAMQRAWAVRELWPAIGKRAQQAAIQRIDPNPARTLLQWMINEPIVNARNCKSTHRGRPATAPSRLQLSKTKF